MYTTYKQQNDNGKTMIYNQRNEAQKIAKWVLTDNFDKLENWEDENGCITTFIDGMWDLFSDDTEMSTLLERAYNKWTKE